jgi:hypothetical protein
MAEVKAIPDERPLTEDETSLVRWLLEHGTAEAAAFLPQLGRTCVATRCACGCRSIDFAIDGRRSPVETGQQVLSEYFWKDSAGHAFGVFVFASGGMLGGLDIYSADGLGENCKLPSIEQLQSVDAG